MATDTDTFKLFREMAKHVNEPFPIYQHNSHLTLDTLSNVLVKTSMEEADLVSIKDPLTDIGKFQKKSGINIIDVPYITNSKVLEEDEKLSDPFNLLQEKYYQSEGKINGTGDYYETPEWLFLKCSEEFNYCYDLAATAENKKCEKFISEKINSLTISWRALLDGGWGWLNPPYSAKLISLFMRKCATENLEGAYITALVRADPTAKWFKKYVIGHALEVRLISKRIRFVGAKHSYNFPSCLVVYTGEPPTGGTTIRMWEL